MDAVVKALRVSAPRLLELPNVIGVGKGTKCVGGQCTGKPSITVLVTKKVPKAKLHSCDIVPKSIDMADTDVIEVGEVVALARMERYRPAVPGSSIGHYKITAGTFGAVVYDVKTGEPLILSNNHVLANSSNGRDGRCAIGDPILQPGRYDNGTDKDVIARLHRFVPISMEVTAPDCPVAASFERTLNKVIRRFRRNYSLKVYATRNVNNLVDAAVAKPVSPDIISDAIIDLGVPQGIGEVNVGDRVAKSGRTTGTNWGEVRVVQATIRISMGDAGDAVFTDQCVTTHMAQPGDSGSVVLNEKKQVVGLLSAGSDTVSIFGRIQNVCSALGVTFTRPR
ncbi:MAG TPA: hypothetical protein GXX23_01465 [Firmicutes bacterium]|nr:hypothetical protein [Candidatus Fermentithermobacillaceae bacterium]